MWNFYIEHQMKAMWLLYKLLLLLFKIVQIINIRSSLNPTNLTQAKSTHYKGKALSVLPFFETQNLNPKYWLSVTNVKSLEPTKCWFFINYYISYTVLFNEISLFEFVLVLNIFILTHLQLLLYFNTNPSLLSFTLEDIVILGAKKLVLNIYVWQFIKHLLSKLFYGVEKKNKATKLKKIERRVPN